MAYAESTVGGSSGGYYRVWVNSIRTYDGSASENFEDWRVEGGLNKISTGTYAYNNYGNSSYTVQLGMNGVASSGNFNYNFASGTTGTVLAWATGSTRVYRSSAGVGFGFQSRMDINLQNSPYLTSGWVTSNDSVQTKYRHASLTALSMDSGGVAATDEGPMWLEFSNPSGAAVDAWIEAPPSTRIFTSGSISSRYNFTFNTALKEALQAATPNSNTGTLRIGIHDSMGGDSWDYRDRTYTIKNDAGQANPLFSDFTFADTNSTTVAITGSDQVLIQGKSTLQTTVSVANKAVAQKHATMSSYITTVGSTAVSSNYSSSSDVVSDVGTISDVSGLQSLAVRAVDSRYNGTTVTKNVTILPYSSPALNRQIKITYTNSFDYQSGLTVDAEGSKIATISPMTLAGVDKNTLDTTTGIQFDMSKSNNTSYTGSWTNVEISRDSNSSDVTTVLSTLATSILAKMSSMTLDNAVKWYVKFKIVDALETQYQEVVIDIGKAVFRIGADDKLYNKEQQLLVVPMVSVLADSKAATIGSSTGTLTPYTISPIYVMYGSGSGHNSTVIFDVNFTVKLNTGMIPTIFNWAFKIDGNVVGNANRKFFINAVNTHTIVNAKVVATGLTKGTHTVSIEIYGGGQNIGTDSADFCNVVATEYTNVNMPLSVTNYSSVAVNGGLPGVPWTNPSNAAGTQNGTLATVTEGTSTTFSQQLMTSGYGFNIPAISVITGIKLEGYLYGQSFDKLITVGTPTKQSTSTPVSDGLGGWGLGGGLHWVAWGGPGELWGRTDWSPVDINSPSFGGGFSAMSTQPAVTDQFDAARITVYYA